ncbi:hypothetical protein [Pelosinus fermentans]|uniref:Phage protein, HK97 gp10 family n=1 Tax=Pelosinus fermentans JBW45 TaxID=1192197 RepID=I8TUM2_9FIRM|nr:hypothetical protein [Pelosinus fermentans]AJQ26914.1 hypothetical protein JBW_01564 [Pelosinus fermentans JBW45]
MDASTRETEEALLNLSNAFIRNNRLAIKTASVVVQRQARAKHKFRTRTGAAESAIETQFVSKLGLDVGFVRLNNNVALHAMFMHEGTKPHMIRAKNKKSLRWVTAGGFAFATSVRHPGTKADPFLYNALDDCAARIDAIFDRYAQRTIMESGLS